MHLNYAVDLIAAASGRSLHEVELEHEVLKSGQSAQEIRSYLARVLQVMSNAVSDAIHDEDNRILGKIIGHDSVRIRRRIETHRTVCGSTIATAAAYAIGTMEVNASMGKVVASPTAGSCGVLPAVLMTTRDRFQLSEEQLVDGLLVANAIGRLIAGHATIAGAEGGCQAEVGSASAMASGAVVHMMGGSPEQVFHAAAICLKNLMGLVCDPIAGLVESPCAKRNAIGAANALMCAELALAGVPSIVPFDEAVEAMYRVGRALPPSLRETSLGGIATTKTALQIQANLFQNK